MRAMLATHGKRTAIGLAGLLLAIAAAAQETGTGFEEFRKNDRKQLEEFRKTGRTAPAPEAATPAPAAPAETAPVFQSREAVPAFTGRLLPGRYIGYRNLPNSIQAGATLDVDGLEIDVDDKSPAQGLTGSFWNLHTARQGLFRKFGSLAGSYRANQGTFKGTARMDTRSTVRENIDGEATGEDAIRIGEYTCFRVPDLEGAYWETGDFEALRKVQQQFFVQWGPDASPTNTAVFLNRTTLTIPGKVFGTISDNGQSIGWKPGKVWHRVCPRTNATDVSGIWRESNEAGKIWTLRWDDPWLMITSGGELRMGVMVNPVTLMANVYDANGLAAVHNTFSKQLEWKNGTVWTRGGSNAFEQTAATVDPGKLDGNGAHTVTETEFSWKMEDQRVVFKIDRKPPTVISPGIPFTLNVQAEAKAALDYRFFVTWKDGSNEPLPSASGAASVPSCVTVGKWNVGDEMREVPSASTNMVITPPNGPPSGLNLYLRVGWSEEGSYADWMMIRYIPQ